MAQEQELDDQVALTAEKIRAGKTSLGIEFGSTRIKAVLIDDTYHTIAAGDYGWASHLENGLWSYTQEEIWKGLQTHTRRWLRMWNPHTVRSSRESDISASPHDARLSCL